MKRPLLAPLLGLILGLSFISRASPSILGWIFLCVGGILFLFFFLILRSTKGVFVATAFLFALLGCFLGKHELKRIEQASNLLQWADGQKNYVIGRVIAPC